MPSRFIAKIHKPLMVDALVLGLKRRIMVQIVIANKDRDTRQIQELFWEYLQWANENVNCEFGVSFDIENMLQTDLLDLDKFMPPKGRLLLCYVDKQLAGTACLKYLSPSVGEIKRMYVRPKQRKNGLGRALIERIFEESTLMGYNILRLDSAGFMGEAHRLYRSLGFKEIPAYTGSEIPQDFQKNWIFMELEL